MGHRKQWTTDGARGLVGHQVDKPVSIEEKVRAVKDLTRDDDVAVQVTALLLSRPETTSSMPAAEWVRVVKEVTRDDEVATRRSVGRQACFHSAGLFAGVWTVLEHWIGRWCGRPRSATVAESGAQAWTRRSFRQVCRPLGMWMGCALAAVGLTQGFWSGEG
ncbi:DUF6192 family protein [Streptomyces sp. NPDC008141]|uniref:DUF6192 family protein n=1 Tax=Streptomyces sp. NPDC008141 TaxID=3364815 RepID=UPI0036EBCCD9